MTPDIFAPERIHAVQPDARIIVILRDPVQRAYAQYLMDFNEGVLDLPFMEALLKDCISCGDSYHSSVKVLCFSKGAQRVVCSSAGVRGTRCSGA